MNYYYADSDNKPVGPLAEDELHGLYQGGQITLDTFIVPEGDSEWSAYRSLTSPTTFQPRPIIPPPKQQIFFRQEPVVLAPVINTKECPFCAESISIAAKKCKHCGETLDVALRAAEEAKRSSGTNQPMVFMNAGGGVSVQPQKKSFPHILHLVVTLITMGFWLPIWILHYLFRDRKTYD